MRLREAGQGWGTILLRAFGWQPSSDQPSIETDRPSPSITKRAPRLSPRTTTFGPILGGSRLLTPTFGALLGAHLVLVGCGADKRFEQPTETSRPFGAAAAELARDALAQEGTPAPDHPYAQHMDRVRRELELLGLLKPGTARIHIVEKVIDHARLVARAAAGKLSLARGAAMTIDLNGAPSEFLEKFLPKEDLAVLEEFELADSIRESGLRNLENLGTSAVRNLFEDIIFKRAALAWLREEKRAIGEADRKLFVNLSIGTSPDRVASIATTMLMTARGPIFDEMVERLGHTPEVVRYPDGRTRLRREEVEEVKEKIVERVIREMLGSPAIKARLDEQLRLLEEEVARGRSEGILVFQAAGNKDDARDAHDPMSSLAGKCRGMIVVAASDLGGPGPSDDVIASFSVAGDVAAPGYGIPVGSIGAEELDHDGTSFAAPIAAEIAYAMNAANPNLTVDQLASLLVDPRATRDIPKTSADGAGHIDFFAAVLLAANPALSRADIDRARAILDDRPTPEALATLKIRLGLAR